MLKNAIDGLLEVEHAESITWAGVEINDVAPAKLITDRLVKYEPL